MNILSTEYLRLYANFFNRSYMIDYINKKNPKIIQHINENKNDNIIKEINELTYSGFFDYIYEMLKKDYKCEYVYLNEILLNEILKKHDQNHKIYTELKINKSSADLVVINGTTTVYEIKTELDTFSRLEGQLTDYIRTMEKVYVVTHKNMVERLADYIEVSFPSVGIYTLTRNNRLKLIKKAHSNKVNFDKNLMFKVLNRKEFEYFSKDYYSAIELFNKLSIDECHNFLKKSLFNRAKDLDYLLNVPESLKLAAFKINNNLNNKQRGKFISKLNKTIKEDL